MLLSILINGAVATQLTGNMRTALVDCLLVGVHSHEQGKSKLLPYHTTIDENYLQFDVNFV